MVSQNPAILPLSCENSNGGSVMPTPNMTTTSTTTATTSTTTTPKPSPPQSISPSLNPQDLSSTAKLLQRASKITEYCWAKFQNSATYIPPAECEDAQIVDQVLEEVLPSLRLFKDEQSCNNEQCSLHATSIDHFHCFRTGCMDTMEMDQQDKHIQKVATISSGDMDSWREHWFMHAWQSTLSIIGFVHCVGEICNSSEAAIMKEHFHCYFWPACEWTCDKDVADSAKLLRHLTRHNQHFGTALFQTKDQSNSVVSEQRKRGRPPKHSRDIHIPRLDISPERCADPNPSIALTMEDFQSKSDMIAGGIKFFPAEAPLCVDRCCPYYISKQSHFHCIRPRCYMATTNLDLANLHRQEFHAYVKIEPGYEYFDRAIDCRRPACYVKRDTAHYHCLRPRCGYSFVRVNKMKQHTEFHEGVGNTTTGGTSSSNSAIEPDKTDDPFDSCFYQSPSIPLPLGLEKGGNMQEIMPFLMRFLTEQMIPGSRPEAPTNTLQESAESVSAESEEKMDWNESVTEANNGVVAMDDDQTSEKLEGMEAQTTTTNEETDLRLIYK